MTQIKLIIYGAAVALIAAVLGTCYLSGRTDSTQKADLAITKATVKLDRETLKITHTVDMRVNAEGIQTAQSSKDATDAIERIRASRAAVVRGSLPENNAAPNQMVAVQPGPACDDDCRLVLQLAAEARSAAKRSSASLQPAGAGTR